jgi:hypothetical protein
VLCGYGVVLLRFRFCGCPVVDGCIFGGIQSELNFCRGSGPIPVRIILTSQSEKIVKFHSPAFFRAVTPFRPLCEGF